LENFIRNAIDSTKTNIKSYIYKNIEKKREKRVCVNI